MKILTTLILMTVSAIAFAEPTFSNPQNFSIVSQKEASELEAEYKGMINQANVTLKATNSTYEVDEVRTVVTKMVIKQSSCADVVALLDKLECKQNKADLIEVLTADVIKSHQ